MGLSVLYVLGLIAILVVLMYTVSIIQMDETMAEIRNQSTGFTTAVLPTARSAVFTTALSYVSRIEVERNQCLDRACLIKLEDMAIKM